MFKKARQLTFVLLLITATILPNSFVHAVDFNPNFIISDEEMQNYSCMTREDIQAFLSSYNGYVANYRAIDLDGNERLTADIIYRAAQAHKINPKYILVKLQKEQSLITDKDPSQKQLDWATGYGVCDACNFNDPNVQKQKGFANQIDSSAGIIRWYYENSNGQPWIKRPGTQYSIDGISVQPSTLATAFLYTYTPHLTGNKNFWTLWQQWFQQIYPDYTLIKSSTSPTVYLIQKGKKRPFSSLTSLVTRYDPKLIVIAPESEIMRYEDGAPISLPNYSIVRNSNNYYLIDDELLRPFQTSDVVRQLGYNPEEIIDIQDAELPNYVPGPVITVGSSNLMGRLIKLKENKQIYYIKDGILHNVPDIRMTKINFPNLSIEPISLEEIKPVQIGEPIHFKNGTLIGLKQTSEIYVIENGQKRHIPSEETFHSLGYSLENIIWTDEITLLNHPTAEPLYLQRTISTTTSTLGTIDDIVIDGGKMASTSLDKTIIIGTEFTTPVNTYLVADDKGTVLAGKNIDDPRPIASFTKVITAYRLMKEGLSLVKTTTYNKKTQKAKYGTFRVVDGEKILNSDLMYSTLVSSMNTPTNMLVSAVEKNRANFVKRMNEQVKQWGLQKTKFADVTGEDVKNISTARDYLTMYLKASSNTEVEKYLETLHYTYDEVKDLDKKPTHFDSNSNHLMEKTDLPFTIINSKTGYLDEAGSGVVMLIERISDKKRFYVISMGNPDYVNRFYEPEKLARWTIANF